MKKRALIYWVFGLASSFSLAQEPRSQDSEAATAPTDPQIRENIPAGKAVNLDLKQAIAKALTFAPQLDVAQMTLLEREAQLAQAKAASWVPEFKMRVLSGPVNGVSDQALPENGFQNVPFENDFNNLGLYLRVQTDVVQPLYTFGQLKNLKLAAQNGIEAAEFGVQKERNELVAKIKEIYWTITYLEDLQDFIEDMLERVEKTREEVEKRLQEGSEDVTDIDLMRVKVFREETQRRLIDLQAGTQFAYDSLKTLTGHPHSTQLSIKDKDLRLQDVEIKSFDFYWSRTLVARPEIFQIKAGVQAQEHLALSQKAQMYPRLFALGFQRFGVAENRPDIENPYLVDNFNINSFGVTFGLEQNLAFHLTQSKYREEQAKFKKSEAQKSLAMMGIKIEVNKAYTDLLAKQKSYESSRRALKAGRSWVMASSLNFGAGLMPVEDLLQAFLSYSTVRAAYMETIQKFNMALASLSKAVGEEVGKLNY